MATDEFDQWLSVKLKSVNIDEVVFGDYIKGILEGEESQDEKVEALEGILADIPVSLKTVFFLLFYFYIYDFLV